MVEVGVELLVTVPGVLEVLVPGVVELVVMVPVLDGPFGDPERYTAAAKDTRIMAATDMARTEL